MRQHRSKTHPKLAAFVALLLAFPLSSYGEETPGLAIWSWSQSNFNSPRACDTLLDFCESESIVHIDQHIKMRRDGNGYAVDNQESLRHFLKEALRRDITVNALRGERTMFFASNHKKTFAQLHALLRFNASLDEEIRFARIKYDVEPHLTDEWRSGGSSREKIFTDYLSALNYIREAIPEDLELTVDVPFWWDKPEFVCSFNGTEKRFIHHIMDLTDWIGIMSYRPTPDDVIRLSSEEIRYADEHSRLRSVSPGISMEAKKKEEAWTTFHDFPVSEFRKAVRELQAKLSNFSSSRFIMIHDYKSFVNYLNSP